VNRGSARSISVGHAHDEDTLDEVFLCPEAASCKSRDEALTKYTIETGSHTCRDYYSDM
jgi:hypothetical protein